MCMAFKGKNPWFRSGLKVGSWLADAVRYCFGFLGSRVSQGGLELTYGVAWGCFRAYFLDVFWKSISMLFRGCDWEWICEEFWLLFWRPWPRFLASQWNFFGRRFGIFFFQNWAKSGSENGQDFCPDSGHDFCPESGHRGLADCSPKSPKTYKNSMLLAIFDSKN